MSGQTLALAGVFQAAELVRQAAQHGTWSGYAARCCLDSLFELEAQTAEAVYGGKSRLGLGLDTLIGVLSGDQRHAQALEMSVGLLQLQGKFQRDAAMQHRVGESLAGIAALPGEPDHHDHQDHQAHEIALLYQDTVSRLTPRIVVRGKPQYLKTPRTVDWIRTLLFAGLRSAVLWRQLGGGRFSLLLGRKKLLADAERIAGRR